MKNLIVRFVREDAGQDLIEYSLLAALVAVVSVGAMTTLGTDIGKVFTKVSEKLAAAVS